MKKKSCFTNLGCTAFISDFLGHVGVGFQTRGFDKFPH